MSSREVKCLGCTERYVGCHGRNEDGTWRCSFWGAFQAREQERIAREGKARKANSDMHQYKTAFREKLARRRRKKNL